MNDYLSNVNSIPFYVIVALVLAFVVAMCVIFLVKSYKAGIALGMDPKDLKKVMTSSATFTLLPSISILLGVIALSGTLGVPLSWLRLSVIGSLQYELNVAEIAANAYGLLGLRVDQMSIEAFVTIALVMTAGILGGLFCSIFFLKKYLGKLSSKPKKTETGEKKPSFGDHATTAMDNIVVFLNKAYGNSGEIELFMSGILADAEIVKMTIITRNENFSKYLNEVVNIGSTIKTQLKQRRKAAN